MPVTCKHLVVHPGNIPSFFCKLGRLFHLLNAKDGGYLAQAVIVPELRHPVAHGGVLPMVPDHHDIFVYILIIGRYHTPFPGGHHLGGEKRERPGRPQGPCLLAAYTAPKGMGAVFNQVEIILLTNPLNLVILRGNNPSYVYKYYRCGVRVYSFLEVVGI